MNKSIVASLLVLASAVSMAAPLQSTVWKRAAISITSSASPQLQWLERYQAFTLSASELKAQLKVAPRQDLGPIVNATVIELPTPSGEVQHFRIVESAIMTDALAARIPVKTYRVVGIEDRTARGRVDLGQNGFHGFVLSGNGDFLIDPYALGDMQKYIVYRRSDNFQPRNSTCQVVDSWESMTRSGGGNGTIGILGAGDNIKTYRLAMNATGEYTTFYGSEAAANNGVVTSINRVNVVYETDVAIHMNLVYTKCYTSATTDPFTNNNGVTMLGQNQTTCDTNVGNANYDIGHVFSTGGGGVAGLAVVGVTGQKARGVTGSPSPIGDGFDIDYVAHEMGHQYGGNHTFNGTTGSCGGGNRAASAAYEPGSGSTVMAYAGICGAEDLQPHSDAYFHLKSIQEIVAWRNNAGSGGTQTSTSNHTPTVSVPASFTIPQSTPFKLTATGGDVDGDAITYCWEQFDLGTASPPNTDNGSRPIFRSFNPTTNPTRFFPNFAAVLSNTTPAFENPFITNRTAHFQCTVRDNHAGSGGYANAQTTITTSGAAFAVTSPNTAVSLAGGSSQTVTWTVGGSVDANVRILLSTDGGNSYANGTATVLLASTPNDGSEAVTLPNINTTTARIIVEPINNVYFDISNVNFTITLANNPVPVLTSISPNAATAAGAGFTLTVNGSNFVNGAIVRWNGANRTTTFVNAGQLTATIPATDIATVGSANVTVFNPTPGGGTSGSLPFTINPIVVAPSAFTITQGTFISGTVSSLVNSDDSRLNVKANFVGAGRFNPQVNVSVTGTTSAPSASRIDITVEARATVSPVKMTFSAYDYVSAAWVELSSVAAAPTTDTVNTYSITVNPSRYLSGGALKVRVTGYNLNREDDLLSKFQIQTDQISWSIWP